MIKIGGIGLLLIVLYAFSYTITGVEDPTSGWKTLQSEQEVEKIFQTNSPKAIMLFKHSTACNISAGVKKDLDRRKIDKLNVDAYYLDLLRYRSVSNLIEKLSGVKHESPQVIIWKNGAVVYHNSHKNIRWSDIRSHLN